MCAEFSTFAISGFFNLPLSKPGETCLRYRPLVSRPTHFFVNTASNRLYKESEKTTFKNYQLLIDKNTEPKLRRPLIMGPIAI